MNEPFGLEVCGTDSAAQQHTRSKRCHRKRVTAEIGGGRSVTITGGSASLDEFIEVLEDALIKARKARQLKLSLKTFLSMLQDQADNADSA